MKYRAGALFIIPANNEEDFPVSNLYNPKEIEPKWQKNWADALSTAACIFPRETNAGAPEPGAKKRPAG